MERRAIRCFSFLLYMGVAVAAVWLSVRFLLPWGAPFLLAFALAALLEIPVRALIRRGWRRRPASALLSLGALSAVLLALGRLSARGLAALTEFARRSPALVRELGVYRDAIPPERSDLT